MVVGVVRVVAGAVARAVAGAMTTVAVVTVGILPDGYVRTNPLSQVPTK